MLNEQDKTVIEEFYNSIDKERNHLYKVIKKGYLKETLYFYRSDKTPQLGDEGYGFGRYIYAEGEHFDLGFNIYDEEPDYDNMTENEIEEENYKHHKKRLFNKQELKTILFKKKGPKPKTLKQYIKRHKYDFQKYYKKGDLFIEALIMENGIDRLVWFGSEDYCVGGEHFHNNWAIENLENIEEIPKHKIEDFLKKE
jgi:hypothetical protein